MKLLIIFIFMLLFAFLISWSNRPDLTEKRVYDAVTLYSKKSGAIRSSVLSSKKLDDYVKSGVVQRTRITIKPSKADPVFKRMVIKPVVSIKPALENTGFLNISRNVGHSDEAKLTEVCVSNCAALLGPLEGLSFVKDENGNINFTSIK